jgi:hypothetical protein
LRDRRTRKQQHCKVAAYARVERPYEIHPLPLPLSSC